jgi:hypothetical protein
MFDLKVRKKKNAASGGSMNQSGYDVSFGMPPFDPEEFKKLHPHGLYDDASYHKKYQSGRKSPRPKDGQAALDNSFTYSDDARNRIGISQGQFVKLHRTRAGEYHGYVLELEELPKGARSILYKAGLINGKGKIL